jgi:hypothetical protein
MGTKRNLSSCRVCSTLNAFALIHNLVAVFTMSRKKNTKQSREQKRQQLLALVRQVREAAGDYDRATSAVARRSVLQSKVRRRRVRHEGRPTRKGV